jgi:Transglutaminase-like superfamily
MDHVFEYSRPGPLTNLASISEEALSPASGAPADSYRFVHHLVIQPEDAKGIPLPDSRFAENQLRPAAALLDRLLTMDPSPLDAWRPPERRVVGTCRHFAVLSCALLRHRGIPARARCGFATYFQPGQGLDHWITEYWHDQDQRWVRVDSEIIGQDVLSEPEDLRPGQFLTGGEAWQAYRDGHIDAAQFGVYGTSNFGPGEIRGNAIRDLAALNKVEMLPWDEWGRMDASYKGETGADYDQLIDQVAVACASDDPSVAVELYRRDELQVPPALIT